MLLCCRDDRKVIFRKFLDTVKLSRSFAHKLNWLLTSGSFVFVVLDFQGRSRVHHEKHPDDIA